MYRESVKGRCEVCVKRACIKGECKGKVYRGRVGRVCSVEGRCIERGCVHVLSV